MFAKTEVKDLFPTPLWVADLEPDHARPLNEELGRVIYRITEPRAPIPLGSTWQTDPVLHTRGEFAEFVKLARGAAKAALDFLQISAEAFEITGCWANINPQGGLNSPHTHPNNFLSGVYYVQLPDRKGRIVFSDPRPQAFHIAPPTRQWNKYLGNEVSLEAKEGRLVLFPAWLVHSVPVNRGEGDRISISFNIMFPDFTETMSRPLWQGTAKIAEG